MNEQQITTIIRRNKLSNHYVNFHVYILSKITCLIQASPKCFVEDTVRIYQWCQVEGELNHEAKVPMAVLSLSSRSYVLSRFYLLWWKIFWATLKMVTSILGSPLLKCDTAQKTLWITENDYSFYNLMFNDITTT